MSVVPFLNTFSIEGVGPKTEEHIEASLNGLRNLYPGICFEWSEAYGFHVGVPPGREFNDQQIADVASLVIVLDADLKAIGLHPMSGGKDLVFVQTFVQGTRFFTELSRVMPKSKSLFQQLVDDDDL